MEDMGVMLAPTDDALTDWWNNGGGKVLQDNFGTWENVPDRVIIELLKNNQLFSLVQSVPSKFESVLNDAAMEMGITTADVDSVFLGSNGAVYQTNKVFSPMSYSSVLFPAVVSENLSVIYNAIALLEFPAYLNSMVSTYSFFIPVNDGLLTYIDPVSLGQAETHIWKFMMNPKPNSSNLFSQIQAVVYKAEKQDDGTWLQTDSLRTIIGNSATDQVFDRIEDILDNIIVIGAVEQGKSYYMTKGKNFVKVEGTIDVPGQMMVSGGWQIENDQPLTVSQVYNMENGKSYIVDLPIYTAHKAVSDVLAGHDADLGGDGEFSKFYELLRECGALATIAGKKGLNWSSTSKNGNLIYIPESSEESVNYLLNTYHYTIYVPTNDAMDEAYAMGLPTMEMLEEAMEIDASEDSVLCLNAQGDTIFWGSDAADKKLIGTAKYYKEVEDSAAHLRKVMLDFVKYHIQDNSIFIDKVVADEFASGRYETAKTNPSTGRSFKLTLTNNGTDLTVQGVCSNAQNVNKEKMYNTMAREYWLNNKKVEDATLLETSSSVVLHAVDHPLLYKYYPDGLTVNEKDPNTGETVSVFYPVTSSVANQFIYSPFEIYKEVDDIAAETKRK